ncbi:hypothetical protein niasHT_007142 [Heterodera trifolii]|uniref:Uncharacterized protein n=1 Tax=Heterodera trifolii TaxID=157864 RepID=A0ABD2LLQ8_9BILA
MCRIFAPFLLALALLFLSFTAIAEHQNGFPSLQMDRNVFRIGFGKREEKQRQKAFHLDRNVFRTNFGKRGKIEAKNYGQKPSFYVRNWPNLFL